MNLTESTTPTFSLLNDKKGWIWALLLESLTHVYGISLFETPILYLFKKHCKQKVGKRTNSLRIRTPFRIGYYILNVIFRKLIKNNCIKKAFFSLLFLPYSKTSWHLTTSWHNDQKYCIVYQLFINLLILISTKTLNLTFYKIQIDGSLITDISSNHQHREDIQFLVQLEVRGFPFVLIGEIRKSPKMRTNDKYVLEKFQALNCPLLQIL
ncbi:hypothetical protein BpHYR1_007213 [Brachionus plicatilis]|uniref:Uncharacterized protein n=1 Tax=Brachionus plicatilis TaxID=10195 RepID=A0A3M7SQ88_BRAPC|nr:hypothetical protein BpHYR1_007213 [Brachionus plicatilis]